MSEPHTVRSYEEELNQLAAEVARMGGLAEAQVSAAVEAVARRDVALSEAVVARDERIDALELEIENRCIRLVALRQPLANDLRQTLSAIKIAGNLERCGDLAKSIAKRGLVLNEAEPIIPLTRSSERRGPRGAARLKDVLDAYANGDVVRADAVWSRDQEVDEHYNSLFRELLTYMMGDPRTITPCAHLLFIAKNLERIGDHATNIAEIVHYQLTGDSLNTPRPKSSGVA
jgi:phosphate transport system protein